MSLVVFFSFFFIDMSYIDLFDRRRRRWLLSVSSQSIDIQYIFCHKVDIFLLNDTHTHFYISSYSHLSLSCSFFFLSFINAKCWFDRLQFYRWHLHFTISLFISSCSPLNYFILYCDRSYILTVQHHIEVSDNLALLRSRKLLFHCLHFHLRRWNHVNQLSVKSTIKTEGVREWWSLRNVLV